MKTGKWLISFIAISLAVLAVLGAFVYFFDPYYRYHGEEKDYKLLKSRYSDAGIIYNFDYDAVIIGSSLMQNFDMVDFNEKLGCRAVKATIGGITLSEIDYLTGLIMKQGKCKRYYCCLDLALLAQDKESDDMRFSDFLYDSNPFNDYRYLYGYEVWMRFLPVDVGIWAAGKLGINLPDKIKKGTDVNYLEYWADNYTYGAEQTKEKYLKFNNKIVPETVPLDRLDVSFVY